MTWSGIQLQIQTHKLPHIGLIRNVNIRLSQAYSSTSKGYTECAFIKNISCHDYRNMQ